MTQLINRNNTKSQPAKK